MRFLKLKWYLIFILVTFVEVRGYWVASDVLNRAGALIPTFIEMCVVGAISFSVRRDESRSVARCASWAVSSWLVIGVASVLLSAVIALLQGQNIKLGDMPAALLGFFVAVSLFELPIAFVFATTGSILARFLSGKRNQGL
jgi:hypothetical protein